MLILSRKQGQEIVIGDNIRLTIQRIGGTRVTVGISAPDDVRIVRGELESVVKSFEVSGDGTAASAPPATSSMWVVSDETALIDMARQVH